MRTRENHSKIFRHKKRSLALPCFISFPTSAPRSSGDEAREGEEEEEEGEEEEGEGEGNRKRRIASAAISLYPQRLIFVTTSESKRAIAGERGEREKDENS